MRVHWKTVCAAVLLCAVLVTAGQPAAVALPETAAAEPVQKTTHTYGDWYLAQKATDQKNGAWVRVCKDCGAKQTKRIARIKSVTLKATQLPYTGKALQPAVVVTDKDGNVRKAGVAYTVRYQNNKTVGTATVTVTGTGAYAFTVQRTFRIVPQSPKIKTVTPDAYGTAVCWTAVGKQTDGYLLQYSTDSSFRKGVTQQKLSSAKETAALLLDLKAKTAYALRVCAYKKIGKETYCSAWATKTFSTKAAGAHAIAGSVPKSARAAASYFDDVVFVGDSVSFCLQHYEDVNNVLGRAKFLTLSGMGATHALRPVSSRSKHPRYNGQKMKIEQAVPLTGAKKVYIMLGLNDIVEVGVDRSVENFRTLCKNILRNAPQVTLYVQSATPRTAAARGNLSLLNNTTIHQYNKKLAALCRKEGWYFLNVAEALYDGNYLRRSYCDDPSNMGMHPSFAGCKAWVDYLYTHTA